MSVIYIHFFTGTGRPGPVLGPFDRIDVRGQSIKASGTRDDEMFEGETIAEQSGDGRWIPYHQRKWSPERFSYFSIMSVPRL